MWRSAGEHGPSRGMVRGSQGFSGSSKGMRRSLFLRTCGGCQLPLCLCVVQVVLLRLGGAVDGIGRPFSPGKRLRPTPSALVLLRVQPKRKFEGMDLLAANYDTDSSCEDEERRKDRAGASSDGTGGGSEPRAKRLCRPQLASVEAENMSALGEAQVRQVSVDGRVRSFAHVEGNYAGFIYVPMRGIVGLEAAAVSATRLAQAALTRNWKCRQSLDNQPLLRRIPVHELHLSVSRTFALRRRQIEPLVEQLRRNIQGLPCFDASLQGIDLYSNDEKTRSFVGLSLAGGRTRMQSTTRAVDQALSTLSLEPFYKEMRFHVSVAWFAGPVPEGLPSTLVFAAGAEVESGDGGLCDSGGATGGDVKGKDKEGVGGSECEERKTRPECAVEPGQVCLMAPLSLSVRGLEAKIGKKRYTLPFKEG